MPLPVRNKQNREVAEESVTQLLSALVVSAADVDLRSEAWPVLEGVVTQFTLVIVSNTHEEDDEVEEQGGDEGKTEKLQTGQEGNKQTLVADGCDPLLLSKVIL